MTTRHKHRWQRLSDVALFCGCGETKYVAAPVCTLPHYPYGTYYPVYPIPYTVPWPTYPTYIWSADNTSTYTITSGISDD